MSTASNIVPTTADLQQLDRAHIVHPHQVIGRPVDPIVVAHSRGCRIWDTDGKEYLDATCGLWQCAIGHGRPELATVAAEQMREHEFFASFWDFTNEPAVQLGARLADLAGPRLSRVHFTSGGSEGNAVAVKLARLAWDNAGQPDRTVILSRSGAYHGSGAGASLAATGMPVLHEGFGPLPAGFVHLTTPHARHLGTDAADVLVSELEETIERIGGDKIAAFIGEPVMGVAGVIPPPEGYWPRVEAVLRKHGILLILDEVITAFGRLGRWFGFQHFEVEPDFVVTAKAITSGYFPFGAVLIGDRPMELLDGRMLRHGFTYNAHPVGAAVALANLNIIEREGLIERVRELSPLLESTLSELAAHRQVVEVRGQGLMWGVEFQDVDGLSVSAEARDRGVIVRGMENRIYVSPPFVVTPSEIADMGDVLAEVLGAVE